MFLTVVAIAWFAPALIAVDRATTTTINLGGLRQVKAALTTTDREYAIKVRMLPVDCFDSVTNARLNREKAREMALQALARHLADKEAVEFTIAGAQVDQVGSEGKYFVLSLRVPRQGVTQVRRREKPSEKPRSGEVRVAFSSGLFARKQDYRQTLDKLSQTLLSDLGSAEEKSKSQKNDEVFFVAIAEIEERGTENFGRLVEKVQDDLLLLTVEKEELTRAIQSHKIRLLEHLKEAVIRRQTQAEGKEGAR
jgi:hypothetical protein